MSGPSPCLPKLCVQVMLMSLAGGEDCLAVSPPPRLPREPLNTDLGGDRASQRAGPLCQELMQDFPGSTSYIVLGPPQVTSVLTRDK